MFEGAYTALVTPFTREGAVDMGKLRELVELQIDAGIDGLVPVGTTGESPTLGFQEHDDVIEAVIEAAAGRVKVIAGTGGNATKEALRLTRHAKEVGADGTLQVTPYYNKPNQEGLRRHFEAVADVELPVVLYNIPGRTSRELTVETVVTLAQHPYVVAVKEATGNPTRVSAYHERAEIDVLSGDDPMTLPMMILGGVGVISVASNVMPKAVADMVHAALDGRWQEAAEGHRQLYRLFRDLFIDTNPIPVKAAMAEMGLIEEVYRLPMCELDAEKRAAVAETVRAYGLGS